MADLNPARIKRLAKEGVWIVVGQIAAVLGSLALVRVLTGHLSPAEYGELTLGLTVAGLMNQVIFGGISNGISRYYSIAAEAHDLKGYLHDSGLILAYATWIVVALGALLCASLQWFGHSHWTGLIAGAIVFSLLSGYNSTCNGIQNAARQRAVVALHGGLSEWLKIAFAVSFIYWLGTSSTTVVIGYISASLLITTSQLFFLRRTIFSFLQTVTIRQAWQKRIWSYSWPFSAWGIFTWLQQASDRWALKHFSTTEDVGLYSVLVQLSFTPIMLATTSLMSFIMPILFQRVGDASESHRIEKIELLTGRLVIVCMATTSLLFVLAQLFHEYIFIIFTGERYRDISYLMPWMVLAGGLMAGYHIIGARISSTLKTSSILKLQIALSLIATCMNIMGVWLWGIYGIIISVVLYSLMYFTTMLLFSIKTMKSIKT